MIESFATLFEESLKGLDVEKGALVRGTVVSIDDDWITVDTGLKSEGVIAREEFLNDRRELEVKPGDQVDVIVDALDNGLGYTVLSREKAKRAETWTHLERVFENSEIVRGIISGKVKGGFTVGVGSIRAFLPGSLVDIRPIRDTSHLEGKELEFKLIKLDAKRNNVVVSRRAVMEAESSAEREQLLENLQEGQVVRGIIKNLTDYGAFVDLGGIDGLLHITDMAWKRIRHPSEIVDVGQEVNVKILRFDRERNRVSLGLKQLGEDPWLDIVRRYPAGTRVKARITNLTDYGCFAELEEGVEGLVHVSEMDWTNKNVHPSRVVQIGEEVEVQVLEIDEERRRISLGVKQCKTNPWEEFSRNHEKGEKVSGTIKSITDFGIFVGLDGGIDGLVHLSDISWNEGSDDAVRRYKKGDTLEAVILSVDPERERISLGIKQLDQDPFTAFVSQFDKGAMVKGVVKSVDAKMVLIELGDGVEGTLRASEISRDRVEDATRHFKEGDAVESRIIGVDRKSRIISLSVKAKDEVEEREAMTTLREVEPESGSPKTIGDLIRAQRAQLTGDN